MYLKLGQLLNWGKKNWNDYKIVCLIKGMSRKMTWYKQSMEKKDFYNLETLIQEVPGNLFYVPD